MESIEIVITVMFIITMCILGFLSHITLRHLESIKKESEELRYEVERLKRNLTL